MVLLAKSDASRAAVTVLCRRILNWVAEVDRCERRSDDIARQFEIESSFGEKYLVRRRNLRFESVRSYSFPVGLTSVYKPLIKSG